MASLKNTKTAQGIELPCGESTFESEKLPLLVHDALEVECHPPV